MGSSYPATDYIETTDNLFDLLRARLSTFNAWNVYTYFGTDIRDMFERLPAMTMPAAVLAYERSEYYAEAQRRKARIHVVIATVSPQDPFAAASPEWMRLLSKAIELLDGHILVGETLIYVRQDEIMYIGETLACVDVEFDILDH